MIYTYPVEEYAKQLAAYQELEAMSFSPEDSRESILGKLKERSAKKRVILHTITHLAYVYPILHTISKS